MILRAALPSPIPLSLYGRRVPANPGNLLRGSPAATAASSFSAKKLPARMSACIWSPRAGRRKVTATTLRSLCDGAGQLAPGQGRHQRDDYRGVGGTNAQFLDGTTLKGYALGLRIAARNVPNFVDLETGGYGGMIQDGFNSTQTPTMANFRHAV